MSSLIKIQKTVAKFFNRNWGYIGTFSVGTIIGGVYGLFFMKKLLGLNILQFIGKTMALKESLKYDIKCNDLNWKIKFPYSKTRPSNELLSAFDNFGKIFKVDPNWTIKEHLYNVGKLQDIAMKTSKLCPSFVPDPSKKVHVINKSNNVNAYELCYPGSNINNGIIIYCHGGGFIMGIWEFSIPPLSIVSSKTGMIGLCLDYRLANNGIVTIPDQVNDLIDTYEYCLYKLNVPNDKIYFMGESGGAGIILLTIQKMVTLNKYKNKLPNGIIAISPVCDLSVECDSVKRNKYTDFILDKNAFNKSMELAVGNIDLNENKINNYNIKDPQFSCKYGSFKGSCDIYMSASMNEILIDDISDTVSNAINDGVNVTFKKEALLPHGTAAMVLPFPEGRDCLILICDWINEKTNNQIPV